MPPSGRSPISVNQPPAGGSDYPFASPSDDVAQLLGDFQLEYEDDGFTPPLRVSWLHGFGSAAGPGVLAGYPTPTHDRDLRVTDAHGRVVFDSASATAYGTRNWGDRLQVTWWVGTSAACACVSYLSWSDSETPHADYPADIYPQDGTLDPTAYVRTPYRVRSLVVNGQKLSGDVELAGGYNVSLALGDSSASAVATALTSAASTDGRRKTAAVTVRAVPGDGLGVRGGCEPGDPVVRRINGVGPGGGGNLALDMSGCLRLQTPVRLVGVYGNREAVPGPAATLGLHNDCEACCRCDYYARTYKGLRKLWLDGAVLAREAQGVRNLYAANKARWEAQKACREGQPLRLSLIPGLGCRVAVGGSLCNTTGICLSPLVLRTTFQLTSGGADVTAGGAAVCSSIYASGSGTNGDVPINLGYGWPVYDAFFDYANQQDTSTVRYRLCANACDAGSVLNVTLTAHGPLPPGFTPPAVPAYVTAAWATTPPAYPVLYSLSASAPLYPGDRFTV